MNFISIAPASHVNLDLVKTVEENGVGNILVWFIGDDEATSYVGEQAKKILAAIGEKEARG